MHSKEELTIETDIYTDDEPFLLTEKVENDGLRGKKPANKMAKPKI